MHRKFLTLGGVLLAVLSATATPLTPEEALSRALGSTAAKRAPAMNRELSLATTVTAPDTDEAAVYVFSSGDGYVVLSADSQAPAVLGYSDSERGFDPDNISPAMSWWLSQYAGEIGALRHVSNTVRMPMKAPSRADDDYAPIAPLLTTTWNQDAPFNNMCPKDGSRRTVTGCVATAMAQVVKHHNWPPKGVGSNSYTSSQFMKNPQTVSFDFGNTTFDWDNMIDNYSGSYTTAQADAVATLMLALGVASEMQYGVDASGINESNMGRGLIKYMRYDKGMRWEMRQFHYLPEWIKLVYDELAAGRPVSYGGMSPAGGHEFVCDGYQGDGYFHFNWGWGGMSDGYFLLTSLNPELQGIGGSQDYAFNSDQTILSHVMPEQEGSKEYYNWFCQALSSDKSEYDRTTNRQVNINGPFFNLSFFPYTGTMALGCFEEEIGGEIKEVFGEVNTDAPIQENAGLSGFSLYSKMFPEGTYYVYPIFKDAYGEWREMAYYIQDGIGRLKIEANSTTLKISKCVLPPDPSILTFSSELMGWEPAHEKLVLGQRYDLSFEIRCSQDIKQKFSPVICYQSGNNLAVLAQAQERTLDLKAGETVTESFNIEVPDNASTSRTYYIVNTLVSDSGFEMVGDPVKVKLTKSTGIDSVVSDEEATVVGRYDMLGRAISTPTPGTFIIEQLSNGTTRKSVIR